MRFHPIDIRHCDHIAVTDQGDGNLLADLGDRVPIRFAAVRLDTRSPVHRQQRAAVLLDDTGHQPVLLAIFIPPQADLAGHRHIQGSGQLAENPGDHQRCTHQTCTCAAGGDPLRRAAHIDIDDIRSHFLDLERRFENIIRIFSVELEDHRSLVLEVFQLPGDIMRALHHPPGINELGVAHRRPQVAAQRPER